MSVVAARVYDDNIYVAADSIVTDGWGGKRTDTFSKLESICGAIIGGCGAAEEMSLMWQYAQTHKIASATEKDVLNYIIEFARLKNDLIGNASIRNCYIIVYDGKLFEVENMFVRQIKNYTAIGAGKDFAMAALYLGHSPREAVKVACDLCCYVAEPIVEFHTYVDKTEDNKK